MKLFLLVLLFAFCSAKQNRSITHGSFETSNSVNVEYWSVTGKGDGNALLLHGAFTSGQVYLDLITKLPFKKSVAITLRGFGLTTQPSTPEDMSKQAQVDIIISAIDNFHLADGKLTLVVHSAAGFILPQLLRTLYDSHRHVYNKVDKLIVMSSTANIGLKPTTLNFLKGANTTWTLASTITTAQLDTLSFAPLLTSTVPGGIKVGTDIYNRMISAVETGSLNSVRGAYRLPLTGYQEDYDNYVNLPKLNDIKKLGIVGQLDSYFPSDLSTFGSDIEIHVVPNVWHYHFLQSPIEVADIILSWLGE